LAGSNPVSPTGKTVEQGFLAGTEAIPGEDPDELRALRADYYDRFTPDRSEQYAVESRA
jgi:hypothetical protein